MPYKCCAFNCNGNYDCLPRVCVFSFPKDITLQRRWLQALSRKDYVVVTKSSRKIILKVMKVDMNDVAKPNFTLADTSKFYRDVILNWTPKSEVWPFRHGDDILCGSAALTGFYISYFFRKQLKLRHYSKLTCYTPVVGLSTVACYIAHNGIINSNILSADRCSLCILTKSSYLQLGFGLFYPLLMAPIINFYIADKLLTYPIPSLSRAPKEVYQLWLKFILKIPRPIFISAAVQVFLATLVTQQKLAFVIRNF